MSLAAGSRLGVYEIVSLVGAGGMGEVYRARDSRLGRDVAIKVLSPGVATDEERLRRFEQEARAAAALNHPNILAVYDIGTHSGAPYVVSELLEGETLRERLDGGALPTRKAIAIAVQIARGLAAAHGKGIVHRDLKPENVFVLADGHVKLLDFGLAKLIEREPALSGLSAIATTPPETLPGVVLGTIGYMAPEQVRGQAADHRSDLFSFGTILYELLSGQRAFRGETNADTMTAILKEEPPDLSTADRRLPAALARIVGRCLEKAQSARFQSAEDLAFALEALSAGDSGATEAVVGSVATPRAREKRPWVLVGLLCVALVAAVAWAAVAPIGRTPPDRRVMRFTIAPPDHFALPIVIQQGADSSGGRGPVAVSPDGRRIAFIGRSDRKDTLWVRSLDTLTSQVLPGTEGVSAPFWSPDSRFIGFFADRKLKKIDVTGGPPITLCDVLAGTGGTWSQDGTILFASATGAAGGRAPIRRVGAGGGTPAGVTTVQVGDSNHTKPILLPDGRHFLFAMTGQAGAMPVYLTSVDSPARTKLIESDSTNVAYSDGHLLFMRGATLMAQPFDINRLALVSDPFPVAEPIQTQLYGGVMSGVFSASENGVLAYQTGPPITAGAQLVWFDRSGKQLTTPSDRENYNDVELAPNGKLATVSVSNDVWVVDLARGTRMRVTVGAANNRAVWSVDGSRLTYFCGRKGSGDLCQRSSNGSGAEEVLLTGGDPKIPLSMSADGQYLLYNSNELNAPGSSLSNPAAVVRDLFVLPLVGDRRPFVFLKGQFPLSTGRFSPDGRWVAYVSTENGRPEVYVTSFPSPGGRTQVTTTGGTFPRWRRDSKEIFYTVAEPFGSRLDAVSVRATGTAFEVGAVQRLFTFQPGNTRNSYDVTSDGQRFLVNTRDDEPTRMPEPLTVVVNWTTALGHQR